MTTTATVIDGLLHEVEDLGYFELPPPIPEEAVIAARGRCSGTQHSGFLDLSRGNSAQRAEARAMCARCPVQRECRIVADYLDANAGDPELMTGIWAGEGPAARQRRRERQASYAVAVSAA